MRLVIPKTIKFDQDVPPLNQQQLFQHNMNVCKYKLDHLKSKAKLKKKLSETAMTVVALNWRRDHQERMSSDLARSSEKCNCKIFDPSPKSAPLLQFCKLRGHSEQEYGQVSAKNMALGESKSDKGPTRSSFEGLLLKISQGSRGHLVEMKNHRCPFCRQTG